MDRIDPEVLAAAAGLLEDVAPVGRVALGLEGRIKVGLFLFVPVDFAGTPVVVQEACPAPAVKHSSEIGSGGESST